ncbi:hypothetical protein [Streptomyces daliensis]|uniref:Secreted protein n=1 Tax=Streptomyces daliensis TaxID=299421 RepID=A0A8T4ILW9_9ACTN|nr:hypothetical protein [Streptomyces daliensis]
MSAISLTLLATAALATALGGAALHTVRGLHREVAALRARLEDGVTATASASARTTPDTATAEAGTAEAAATVPAARTAASADEIRAAVAEALAEERERELAEARAFWAAQEARDAGVDGGALLAGHGTEYEIAPSISGLDADLLEALLDGRLDGDALEDPHGPHGLAGPRVPYGAAYDAYEGEIFIPRQSADRDPDRDRDRDRDGGDDVAFDGPGPLDGTAAAEDGAYGDSTYDEGPEPPEAVGPAALPGRESPELAAARRRHPSHPDFNLNGDPVVPAPAPATAPTVADRERTLERLNELALSRTPLADVRPGPLGTLDVYVFEDGTTVCLSPGHRETAERLSEALRRGETPTLMGGSGVSGAYSLTFTYGEDQTAYLLADRVIASL